MKLSLKHIAIFGQVKVDLNSLDCKLANYTTLLDLYKDGWWVTYRCGSIITIVKPRQQIKDGFCCLCKRISTNVNLDTLDLLTKPIAEENYQKYKHYLEYKPTKKEIKYGKSNLSILPQRNTNTTRHVLCKTPKGNISKIQGKQ